MYFEEDWGGAAKCNLVDYYTPYFLYTRDDYKRCLCDTYGDGASDCPTDANGPAPFVPPEPTPDIPH